MPIASFYLQRYSLEDDTCYIYITIINRIQMSFVALPTASTGKAWVYPTLSIRLAHLIHLIKTIHPFLNTILLKIYMMNNWNVRNDSVFSQHWQSGIKTNINNARLSGQWLRPGYLVTQSSPVVPTPLLSAHCCWWRPHQCLTSVTPQPGADLVIPSDTQCLVLWHS